MQAEDHARQETRVMAELVRLAAADLTYADVVRAVLDLVEELVSSPLLCLSVRELGGVAHYARAQDGADETWVDEVSQAIAAAHEQVLTRTPAARRAELPGSAAWYLTFPAWTRSGRAGALAIGAPEGKMLSREEERLMRRLAEQIVLVLDHALLLQQIEQLETTDELTGVVNYRRLLELVDYELQRHRYTRQALALLMLDIEGLDGINRSYGRHYGNHILKKIALLVREMVRPIDVVARCGLDEFAVLLPEMDEEAVERQLEAMRARLQGVEFAGGEVGLTIAVACTKPGEQLAPEQLLRRAEQALQEAKRQQKGWRTLIAGRS
jgi:diguanylate cyclase (GGDEF)-like protein